MLNHKKTNNKYFSNDELFVSNNKCQQLHLQGIIRSSGGLFLIPCNKLSTSIIYNTNTNKLLVKFDSFIGVYTC